MKKITQLFVFVAVMFALASFTFGQETPSPEAGGGGGGGGNVAPFPIPTPLNLTMIASRDALRSYALEQVFRAWANVSSPSLLQNEASSFNFSITETPVNISSFHKAVAERPLTFSIFNPKDWISFNVTYANREGYSLFQGGVSARFVEDSQHPGLWRFPETLPPLELYLASEIPLLTVSNIYYARLVLQDERGQSTYNQSVRVDQRGVPFFPSQYAGANGFLLLNRRNNDGTSSGEMVFHLRNGRFQEPASLRKSLNVSIPDAPTVELSFDNPKLDLVVKSDNGHGESPTVQLKVLSDGDEMARPYFFHAKTSEGERAEMIGIRQIGAPGFTWYWIPLLQNGDSTMVQLRPGIYHAIFSWPNFKPYPPYIPGNDGGGKG